MSAVSNRAQTILVEHLDGRGRVVSRDRLHLAEGKSSFAIGRSVEADVTLDDEHAAAIHATLDVLPDGRLAVTDHGSINGVVVEGKRHVAAIGLVLPGNTLQIGRTHLRLRHSGESLAPEKPDHHHLPVSLLLSPAWIAGVGGAAVATQIAYGSWMEAPRDLTASIVWMLGIVCLILAAWIGFWSLLSRVMQGEWRWLRHAAIALGVGAVVLALDDILELVGFMLSAPQWSGRSKWLGLLAAGIALTLHLTHASGLQSRRAAILACLAPLVLGGMTQWLFDRGQVLNVNYIDAHMRIYPPGLRLRSAGAPGDFFKKAEALRIAADRRRASVKPDTADDEE